MSKSLSIHPAFTLSAALLLLAGAGSAVRVLAGPQPPSPGSQHAPSPSDTKVTVPNGSPPKGRQMMPPTSSAPNKSAPVPGTDQKTVHLDINEGKLDEKTGVTTGKQFLYQEKDTVVTGDTARYNKNTRELDAEGSLVLDDPKHHVTGSKSHVDRNKRLAVISGSVIIVLKPKAEAAPDPKNDNVSKERGQGVTITCDKVDDYYKKDFIILNGHLVFKQHIKKADGKMVERTLTAEHAEYDGKKNQMVLFVPVKAVDSEGQEIIFEKNAIVGTKEGEETLTSDGKTNIKFNLDDVKDEPDTAPPPADK